MLAAPLLRTLLPLSRPAAVVRPIAGSRAWILALLGTACLISCRSSNGVATRDIPSLSRHTAAREALGGTYRITLYAPDRPTADDAIAAAFARLDVLDSALNVERPGSEIAMLNGAGDGKAVRIGDDLFAVLQRAQRLAASTRGAIDVTAGPYVDLWSRAAREARAPSRAELEQTRLRVGWDKLRLDAIERSATLTVSRMRLDPGGLVRGYAADEVFRELRRHGCDRARVDAGNVILAGTPPPGRNGWDVLVPGFARRGQASAVTITNTALARAGVALSGDRGTLVFAPAVARGVDPTSGRALEGRVGVVVLAGSGASAESVATAALVMGPGGADALAEAEPGARIRFRNDLGHGNRAAR